jgi:hypothetical protein
MTTASDLARRVEEKAGELLVARLLPRAIDQHARTTPWTGCECESCKTRRSNLHTNAWRIKRIMAREEIEAWRRTSPYQSSANES